MPTVMDVDSVGVRELRQNLSVYLRRVEQGESLRVTEHGRPVALLTPFPRSGDTILDELEAEGRLERPRSRRQELPEPLPPVPPGTATVSEILQRMRDEDPR